MSKRLPTVWETDPHTIAKIEILKGYLDAWFRIFGKTRPGQTILYIDGFAGPGRYRNHPEGSPLAAARIALNTIESLGAAFVAKKLCCAFIEKDIERFEVLSEAIKPFVEKTKLCIKTYNSDFSDGIAHIKKEIVEPFHGKGPLFIFADPFGGTGIPFRTFAQCMEHDTSELLINLDADGIGRIFTANNPNMEDQLSGLFGDESWRSHLTAFNDQKLLSVQILNLYKERLRSLPDVRFIWSFAMRGPKDLINYHLVFATKHPRGLEKMKEAMQKIDRTGSYSFSDADIEQNMLFRDDNEEVFAGKLFTQFEGKSVPYEDVNLFALNETPFPNPKSMLLNLDKKFRLKVEWHPGMSGRAGTYPEEKIRSLQFGRFGNINIQSEFL